MVTRVAAEEDVLLEVAVQCQLLDGVSCWIVAVVSAAGAMCCNSTDAITEIETGGC